MLLLPKILEVKIACVLIPLNYLNPGENPDGSHKNSVKVYI